MWPGPHPFLSYIRNPYGATFGWGVSLDTLNPEYMFAGGKKRGGRRDTNQALVFSLILE